MKNRKKIYYLDMDAVENGKSLNYLERMTRERIITTKDWDRLIFWMDVELALDCLNDYERHCLTANLIDGYSKEEIAADLKVSRQAVLKQIARAKIKIRFFLKEGYETPRKCT